jgi:diguanylate cyclase (GGDEF)-like protein
MYEKVKYWVFISLYLAIWTVFLLKSGDPLMLSKSGSTAAGALPIYEGWRGLINGLYMAIDWMNWPIQTGLEVLTKAAPAIKSDYFPMMEAFRLAEPLQKSLASAPFPPAWKDALAAGALEKIMAGAYYWSYMLTLCVLLVVEKLLDPLYDTMRNLIWNVLIEFSFTKKKQDKYQEELENRTEKMIQLYKENQNLSHKTSELQTSVITDEMTQVYNKRFFVQKMTEEIDKAIKSRGLLALVMMDIDHFKKFNDTYGHLLGDKVLIKVAEAAKSHTPRGSYCCRYGGEEFGVIMPAKTFEEAQFICDAIRNAVPEVRLEEDPNIRVHISQGLVILDYSNPSTTAISKYLDVVKLADDELYRAKEEGRNRLCTKRLDQASRPGF